MNGADIIPRPKIAVGWLATWADYAALARPRLLSLVVLSVLVGFELARPAESSFASMIGTLIGTFFIAAGSMALNQVFERETDRAMVRTRHRPIPSGRLSVAEASRFGLVALVMGFGLMISCASVLSVLIALFTTVTYLVFYTPLKRRTSLATLVGAVPGALPPLIGWAAASGSLNFQALLLFLIMFFWQMPHFLSIAWMYRDDYARAGLPMLSVFQRADVLVARQMILYVCALAPVSLLPTLFGMTGTTYFFVAFGLGIFFSGVIIFAASNLDSRARLVLRASIFYLAVLFVIMMVDKVS